MFCGVAWSILEPPIPRQHHRFPEDCRILTASPPLSPPPHPQPPSSTYYSTVPGDMTSSRMSNSTFSPTYDDPARSDEESDQYGGSTYSGGGPYARAIDSVSQSGTAKRLSKYRGNDLVTNVAVYITVHIFF